MASGSLLPMPWLYCYDLNGDPLPGALVAFYAAGTSFPISTFSDINLSIPNSNPVIANAAGIAGPIYLQPGLSYKVIVSTADSVLVRSLDNIPAAASAATNPTTNINLADLRLTLTSGLPVTTADVTAATTVYVTPYKGNRLSLFDGAQWNIRALSEVGIAVPNVANTIYDVFAWDNSGTPNYETLAWTNDTTRATDVTLQDGVLVKVGAATRRYLGSFRTTAVAGQTEDSTAKRYLWNYYNRVTRLLQRLETAASWTYTTATYRQANANAANQLDFVLGRNESLVRAELMTDAQNTAAGVDVRIGIGVNSTTVATGSGGVENTQSANNPIQTRAIYYGHPGIGRTYLAWLEYSAASGTTSWYGTANSVYGGLTGSLEG